MACGGGGSGGASNAPNLKGTPYKYHVYLATCPVDRQTSDNVRQELERCGIRVAPNDVTRTSGGIELDMQQSWKILFLATYNYTEPVLAQNNRWRTLEVSVARQKANSLGEDYVIVCHQSGVPSRRLRRVELSFPRCIECIPLNPENRERLLCYIEDEPVPCRGIRENMGAALAVAYFYGYIKIIVPRLRDKLRGEIAQLNPNDRVMPSQFFVIIPDSGRGMPSLSDDNTDIEDYKIIKYEGARGSNPMRDYSICIHKIANRGAGNEELFFVGEIPAILVNLYDMREQMSACRRRLETCQFYHHLRELLFKDAECRGKVTFIFHQDYGSGCAPLTDILLDEIRTAIGEVNRQQLQIDATEGRVTAATNQPQQLRCWETFREVDSGPLTEKCLRQPLTFYQIDRKPVGKALIINNSIFESGAGLTKRTGSEVDEKTMVDLLKWLNFEQMVMIDQTVEQMTALAIHYATDACQEGAQAFVCVIMSHGQSGQIYGVDGHLLDFVDFAEIVGRCTELRNKPKIFFVLTPQRADMASLGLSPHDGDGLRRLSVSVGDCLCGFATLQGEDCGEPTAVGSPYIRALDNCIRQHCTEMHLEEILIKVKDDVQNATQETPFDVTSLNKMVVLKH